RPRRATRRGLCEPAGRPPAAGVRRLLGGERPPRPGAVHPDRRFDGPTRRIRPGPAALGPDRPLHRRPWSTAGRSVASVLAGTLVGEFAPLPPRVSLVTDR